MSETISKLDRSASRPVEIVTLLLSAALLCVAAIYNRYPLVYPDTGGYLLVKNYVIRSMFYSLFVYPSHLFGSLLFVVGAQALCVAYLLRIVLRVVFGVASRIGYLIIIAALSILTSLPWFVGFLMPDIFTPMVVLCLFLLAFCFSRLTVLERIFVVLLSFVAEVTHYSHVPIAIGLLIALLGVRIFQRLRHVQIGVPRLVLPASVTLAAVMAMVFSNYLSLGLATYSAGGWAFILARLVADGPATEYLREECGNHGYMLCYWVNRMPMDVGTFLWARNGPFEGRTGLWLYERDEGLEIIERTIERFPLWCLNNAVSNGAKQLMSFETAADFGSFANQDYPTRDLQDNYPADYDAYLGSRQNRRELFVLNWLRPLHKYVVIVSAIYGGIFLLLLARRAEFLPVALLFMIAYGLWLNSFVTGALSDPEPRYAARMVWLLPLFAIGSWRHAADFLVNSRGKLATAMNELTRRAKTSRRNSSGSDR